MSIISQAKDELRRINFGDEDSAVMIDIPGITFEVKRVDAYPTTLEGAVQHNAWWDAMALRHLLEGAA